MSGKATCVRKEKRAAAPYPEAVVFIAQVSLSQATDRVTVPNGMMSYCCLVDKHGYNISTWKTRWLVVDGSTVTYYKNRKSNKPKGKLVLSQYCYVERVDPGDERSSDAVGYVQIIDNVPVKELVKRPYGLRLHIPEEDRSYYFHCKSEDDRTNLYRALRNNLDFLRLKPSVKEEMIAKLIDIVDAPTRGLLKTAIRSMHREKLNMYSKDPLTRALVSIGTEAVEAVREIVEEHQLDVNSAIEGTGNTMLMKAAQLGKVDVIKWLFSLNADPDIKSVDGDTALHHSSRLGHLDCVRLLLENNAKRDITNRFGETPSNEAANEFVHQAITSYFPETRKLALKEGEEMTNAEILCGPPPPGVGAEDWAAIQQQQAKAFASYQAGHRP